MPVRLLVNPCRAAMPADVRSNEIEAAGGDLGGRPATGERIIAALESAGVEFLDDGHGVRLKPPKTKRKPTK